MGLSYKELILKSNEKIKLKLFDTEGQERYKYISKSYYRNADGVLFVFAHDYEESFSNIIYWIDLFEENTTNKDIPKFLIGNKNDLGQLNDEEMFNIFIKEHNILRYISTSAKDNINITEIFEEMVEIINSNFKKGIQEPFRQIMLKEKKKRVNFCENDCIHM